MSDTEPMHTQTATEVQGNIKDNTQGTVPARKPAANEVPYINDSYTFAERKREITLIISLLDSKRDSLIHELGYVDHCIQTRDYPNMNFLDDTEG